MPHMEEHDILFQFPHSAAAGERDFGPKKTCKPQITHPQMWKLNSEIGAPRTESVPNNTRCPFSALVFMNM